MQTLIVTKTVRSGKTIEHDGDICILGDTNPAATVIAGGNILVFGDAKGTLVAGNILGDSAIISANRLLSHHLQIGKYMAKMEPNATGYPEYVKVVNGQLICAKIRTSGGE